jgi:3-oxoacyl-[acyl-carrier-protein] synthase II
MRDVYIVKHTIATVLGDNLQTTWQRLLAGQSAFEGSSRPAGVRFGSAQAACLPGLAVANAETRVCALTRKVLDPLPPLPSEICIIWAGVKAIAEFIEAGQPPHRPWLPEHYQRWVAKTLDLAGRGFDVNAACASSTVGIAIAAQKIARSEYGCVLVCAADTITHFVARGFSVLKALTRTRCRPFDIARDGLCMGDGAFAMLLADEGSCRKYDLERLAKISGWGISNDANHITGPATDGAGLVRAIEAALKMAGLQPHEVQAFCAHGTGTSFNDGMELTAIETIFGKRRFPLFSIKGAIGHTLGAAGGIEAAVCVSALADRRIPPTAGLENPERKAQGRVSARPQAFEGANILTSNSGFGGINAALLLSAVQERKVAIAAAACDRPRCMGRESGLRTGPVSEHLIRPHEPTAGSSAHPVAIHVIGGGWITPGGYGRIGDWKKAAMAPGHPVEPPISETYAEPPLRYHRFDRYCRIGCAAIALALQDAGMNHAQVARPVGIVASTRYGCLETDLAFNATTQEANGAYASPALFSYTLPGIAISEAAIHFRLTGPTFTAGDPVGQRGYQALRIAVDLISSGVCRTILSGWLETGTELLKHPTEGDDGVRGAIFLVLSSEHAQKAIYTIQEKGFDLFTDSGVKISAISDLVA